MYKYTKVIHLFQDGCKFRALIYVNDNTIKYLRPLNIYQTDSDFHIHALKMIGWK